MTRHTNAIWFTGILVLLNALTGCHAKDDDPVGQAGELSDPQRREHALTNLETLYTQALARANGDRSVATLPEDDDGHTPPGPAAIADASAEALSRTYIDNESGSVLGMRILALLNEMQDARGLPALLSALEWRQEVSEDHATAAAQAIQRIELSAEQKGQVIEALGTALERIEGNRPEDNRMRLAFIRALGSTNDERASEPLMRVATRIHASQPFEFNRQAGMQVGHLRAASSVPDLIKTLFLFGANRPDMRMNDVGGQALTQVGESAIDPLLALLNGDNADANRLATAYIEAVNRVSPDAASRLNDRTIVVGEACFALGQLGDSRAWDPVVAQVTPLTSMTVEAANESGEPSREIYSRAIGCGNALVQVTRNDAQNGQLREILQQVYERVPEDWPPEAPYTARLQVLAAMAHTYDRQHLDFLFNLAQDREGLPDTRVVAFRTYAMLAGGSDVARIREVMTREREGSEIRNAFNEMEPALAVAEECGAQEGDALIQCYITKLNQADAPTLAVQKAANMIGQAGGNAAAITALISQLDHEEVEVRGDVLYALDHVAPGGSPEAVAEIDRIREAEEGRSSWNQIQSLAMAVQGRLQARAHRGS